MSIDIVVLASPWHEHSMQDTPSLKDYYTNDIDAVLMQWTAMIVKIEEYRNLMCFPFISTHTVIL